MAVQQEIKSQLAKLLATEDIIVEHKDVETAQFNVHTRELLLPLWEKASENVYDMLVGHEVGHALFTPDEDPPEGIPHNFLNVCEDARIEKLMKRKYLGIAKSFHRGYTELHDKDFFEIDGEDISNFNLADRANLHFKIGSFLDLSFSTPEKEIITLIQNAETFTETIAAAEALYRFCQQETQQKAEQFQADAESGMEQDMVNGNSSTDTSDSGDSDVDSVDNIDSSVSNSDSHDSVESGKRSPDCSSGSHADDPTVETAEAFNSSIQDLINYNGIENAYIERPDLNIENIIVKDFIEKPRGDGDLINGGFFVLSTDVIDLISGSDCIWEQEPLKELANSNELMAYEHDGFWQPMDTLRDKELLEKLWQDDKAPWKKW